MDGRRGRTVLLALLAALAVILVAAAVAPVFSQDRIDEGQPDVREPSGGPAGQPGGPDVPVRPIVVAIAVLCVLALAIQFANAPRRTIRQVALLAVGLALVIGVARYLGQLERPDYGREPEFGLGNVTRTPMPDGSAGTGSSGGSGPELAWQVDGAVLVALLAVGIALGAVLAWRLGAAESLVELVTDRDDEDDEDDLDEVRRVASDAADRVRGASTPEAADNAIYRAWSEMVALLGVSDPQSSTPRQFATAAVDAGMDPDDVTVLTRTFEEVRYGDASLSERRRERAVDAFGRIAATHGDETDAAAGSDASTDLAAGGEPEGVG